MPCVASTPFFFLQWKPVSISCDAFALSTEKGLLCNFLTHFLSSVLCGCVLDGWHQFSRIPRFLELLEVELARPHAFPSPGDAPKDAGLLDMCM